MKLMLFDGISTIWEHDMARFFKLEAYSLINLTFTWTASHVSQQLKFFSEATNQKSGRKGPKAEVCVVSYLCQPVAHCF